MAERDVEELFGGQGQPEPRARLVGGLLVTGLVLAVFGLACSAVPGTLVVLLAWSAAEQEKRRLENGYYALESKDRVEALGRATHRGVLAVVGVMMLQSILFCTGFYEGLWGRWMNGPTEDRTITLQIQ